MSSINFSQLTTEFFRSQLEEVAAASGLGLQVVDEAAIALHAADNFPVWSRIGSAEREKASAAFSAHLASLGVHRLTVRNRYNCVELANAINRSFIFIPADDAKLELGMFTVQPLRQAVAAYVERMLGDDGLRIHPLLTAHRHDEAFFRETIVPDVSKFHADLRRRFIRDLGNVAPEQTLAFFDALTQVSEPHIIR